MPRDPRIFSSEFPYHLISRGNNGVVVFRDDEDRSYFLKLLAWLKKNFGVSILHFSLMINHIHLVIWPPEKDPAMTSVFMKELLLRYSLWYGEKYGQEGHLWKNRFKSYVIGNDSYMLTCGIYVELNAWRAGIVEQPEDYRWSSAGVYLRGETNSLITLDPAFLALGATDEIRRAEYRKLVKMWQQKPVSKKEAVKYFKKGALVFHPKQKIGVSVR
ncbi:MAG: transposase [Patescibacteria group bacterium]